MGALSVFHRCKVCGLVSKEDFMWFLMENEEFKSFFEGRSKVLLCAVPKLATTEVRVSLSCSLPMSCRRRRFCWISK